MIKTRRTFSATLCISSITCQTNIDEAKLALHTESLRFQDYYELIDRRRIIYTFKFGGLRDPKWTKNLFPFVSLMSNIGKPWSIVISSEGVADVTQLSFQYQTAYKHWDLESANAMLLKRKAWQGGLLRKAEEIQ